MVGTATANNNESRPTGAPFMGTMGVNSTVRHCWIRCGCWRVHMHMVVRAQLHLTVKDVVDKVEQVVVVLLKSEACDPSISIIQTPKGVFFYVLL